MNRIDNYERMYLGESLEMPAKASRIDALWQAILNGEELPFEPIARVEKYLAKMIDNSIEVPEPTTRLEEILCAICNGEKVDAETKNACKDEYLKYIYELTSGENMFVPMNKLTESNISFDGRTIKINGTSSGGVYYVQNYIKTPVQTDDTVTLRYKYIGGSLTGSGSELVRFVPGRKDENNEPIKSVETRMVLDLTNYMQEQVVVTKVIYDVEYFIIIINKEKEIVFDNLTFEVSFEKGDTTT